MLKNFLSHVWQTIFVWLMVICCVFGGNETCSDPNVSPNGSRVGDCCSTGAVLTYSCNDGYDLVGADVINCLKSGDWSSERPLCRQLQCPAPPCIPNAYYEFETGISRFPGAGTLAKYFCKAGYYLENENDSTLNCSLDSAINSLFWQGERPHCVESETCPAPDVSPDGSVAGDCCFKGAELRYSCKEGYDLVGSSTIECLQSGNWSSKRPLCKPVQGSCDLPPYIPHGVTIPIDKSPGDYYQSYDEMEVLCEVGYEYIGETRFFMCFPNGEWDQEFGECKGGYHLDNADVAGETSEMQISQKHERQKKEAEKGVEIGTSVKDAKKLEVNHTTSHVLRKNGEPIPKSRILDLNYPKQLVLYFIFDNSRRVGRYNFKRSIAFAKALVEEVGISETGVKAGAVATSIDGGQIHPIEYETTEDVLTALDSIRYTGKRPSTSFALEKIRDVFIPVMQAIYGRKRQKSVIFIMTNDEARGSRNATEVAEELKSAGVEIFGIRFSDDVERRWLNKIVSVPKEKHIFTMQNYATMSQLILDITNIIIDYSKCGQRLASLDALNRGISPGSNHSSQPWPWMAMINFFHSYSYDELQCSGSIINRNFILTASHCLVQGKGRKELTVRNADDIIVKVGLRNVSSPIMQEHKVDKIYIHPMYNMSTPMTYDYDIALLRLKNPIEFNSFVRPICLPPAELPPESHLYGANHYAFATNWCHNGTAFQNQNVDAKSVGYLKEMIMPIQTRDKCIQTLLYNGVDTKAYTERMFCADDVLGGNEICRGDSGGPLIQSQMNLEGNFYWTQIGIASWDIGCGLLHAYYTDVQKLLPFVKDTIRDSKTEQKF